MRIYLLMMFSVSPALDDAAKVVLLCYYLHLTVHHLLHDVEIGGMTSHS